MIGGCRPAKWTGNNDIRGNLFQDAPTLTLDIAIILSATSPALMKGLIVAYCPLYRSRNVLVQSSPHLPSCEGDAQKNRVVLMTLLSWKARLNPALPLQEEWLYTGYLPICFISMFLLRISTQALGVFHANLLFHPNSCFPKTIDSSCFNS